MPTGSAPSTRDLLHQLERWGRSKAPAALADLRPGATQTALDELEQLISFPLPEAFRALYSWHDGQNWNMGGLFSLGFLSLQGVKSEWKMWRSIEQASPGMDDLGDFTSTPHHAIQLRYSTPGWLGFLTDTAGDTIGLDFTPAPSGVPGQIIGFGRNAEHKYVLADSLHDFLDEYLQRLLLKQYTLEHYDNHPIPYVMLHDELSRPPEVIRNVTDYFPWFGATAKMP
ncbi:hypothetical protein E7T09_11230 [Deinococcus sp. KSM4-11]|uniref:SMI1/KNR4 family protein n=1 Tax=Deinococcus sp. KSM4-11 TaxID=2568654 RepID=UPI0010A5190A|nr:SMI1/KNR4 family protein [Deinococcus sp. KSM4-11]THF86659.1 hypothetical protein E7T09_11230 [Deinococcus sp. KSM4-11]